MTVYLVQFLLSLKIIAIVKVSHDGWRRVYELDWALLSVDKMHGRVDVLLRALCTYLKEEWGTKIVLLFTRKCTV